ncbi:MAG: PEGA domain-containing protein [Myxococcales bacterium]|nr:PEGA domain-containing protein [Myxococcales bacterium]
MKPVLLALALFIPASLALAEQTLVLNPQVEPKLGNEERASLEYSLQAAVAAEGAEVVIPDEPGCESDSCAFAELQRSNADHALRLTVWKGPHGEASGVSVSLIDRSSQRYVEGVQLSAKLSLLDAVTHTTRGAYARLRRGPGPWLEVSGEPPGATVAIDGQVVGKLPQLLKVPSGLHHLVIDKEGYEPHETTVTMPRNADALHHLEVVLDPRIENVERKGLLTSDLDTPDAPLTRPSALNYTLAAVGVSAGAFLAIGPVRTLIDDGECGRIKDERCTHVVDFDLGQAIQLSGATLLAATGIALVLWSPFRVRVSDEEFQLNFNSSF